MYNLDILTGRSRCCCARNIVVKGRRISSLPTSSMFNTDKYRNTGIDIKYEIGYVKVCMFLRYRVFIRYSAFSKICTYIPDSLLSRFPFGASECTQWQVKRQRCSRTWRVQKNHNILRKNTIFNEYPAALRNVIQANKDFSSLIPDMLRSSLF